jgi:hypothetical protein
LPAWCILNTPVQSGTRPESKAESIADMRRLARMLQLPVLNAKPFSSFQPSARQKFAAGFGSHFAAEPVTPFPDDI